MFDGFEASGIAFGFDTGNAVIVLVGLGGGEIHRPFTSEVCEESGAENSGDKEVGSVRVCAARGSVKPAGVGSNNGGIEVTATEDSSLGGISPHRAESAESTRPRPTEIAGTSGPHGRACGDAGVTSTLSLFVCETTWCSFSSNSFNGGGEEETTVDSGADEYSNSLTRFLRARSSSWILEQYCS